jgi:hypothetical protein
MGWTMTNLLDLRHDWFRGSRLNVESALGDFGVQQCSDLRDKVYGLLGLMAEKPCMADYAQSTPNCGLV